MVPARLQHHTAAMDTTTLPATHSDELAQTHKKASSQTLLLPSTPGRLNGDALVDGETWGLSFDTLALSLPDAEALTPVNLIGSLHGVTPD